MSVIFLIKSRRAKRYILGRYLAHKTSPIFRQHGLLCVSSAAEFIQFSPLISRRMQNAPGLGCAIVLLAYCIHHCGRSIENLRNGSARSVDCRLSFENIVSYTGRDEFRRIPGKATLDETFNERLILQVLHFVE